MQQVRTMGSMFTGVGGIDLGLEEAFPGARTLWQVENEPHCSGVLNRRWPGATLYGDVRDVELDQLQRVDLLSAGFPCQPASLAGKRKGASDDRWLWPHVHRFLRALRPGLAVLENVPGLLTVDDGRLFGRVLGDLAESGYDARWACVRASDIGAPHRRARLFIICRLVDADDAGR